jgi:uncharacterized protein YegL
MPMRPGGQLARRPLHFIWLADCSGSMSVDGKIQALNTAIREAIPHMRDVANENPNAEVLVRAISFSTGARWHISQPASLESFQWVDLTAGGSTDMGQAFRLLSEQLKMPPMPPRALPPVLVLISDGLPTDDYRGGLKQLMAEPWAQKAVRVAIAIGKDANLDVLERFIADPEITPVRVSNPQQLAHYIRWASTAVLKSASSPASQARDAARAVNVPIPPAPPPTAGPGGVPDVW